MFIVCTTETYIEKSSRGFFGLQLGTKRSGKKILEDGHLEKMDRPAYQKMVDEEGDAQGWHLKSASRDCYSTTALPDNWRRPRTSAMLSWRGGDLDMAFVKIPRGVMSDLSVQNLNEELDGIAMVFCTERISHMWDGSTCVSSG